MAADVFGWDLLYSNVEKDVKNNQDILVCLVHLVLVSSGLKCVGSGTSKSVKNLQGREVLPNGWNRDGGLRYVDQDGLYIFTSTHLETGVMLKLERVNSSKVALVQLKSGSVVKSRGLLQDMIPDYTRIVDVIRKQLLEKVVEFRKYKEVSVQAQESVVNEAVYNILNLPIERLQLKPKKQIEVIYKPPDKSVQI